MKIKICGIPFNVEEVDVIEESSSGITQGMISHTEAKIYLKKSLPKEMKKSVLYHELLRRSPTMHKMRPKSSLGMV